MYQIKNENKIAFYLALFMATMFTSAFAFAIVHGESYNGNEMASAMMRSSGEKPKTETVYEFKIKHTDGGELPVRLVRFIEAQCKDIQKVGLACWGGWTDKTSNNARKQDQEHPVDTQEEINLVYLGGKPEIQMKDFVHESNHAILYHWLSRVNCESNWRYAECMEKMAYDQQFLYEQIVDLSKYGKLKIRF